jgi:hypothetical protein
MAPTDPVGGRMAPTAPDSPGRPWLKLMKINDFGILNLTFFAFLIFFSLGKREIYFALFLVRIRTADSEKSLLNLNKKIFINNLIENIKIR